MRPNLRSKVVAVTNGELEFYFSDSVLSSSLVDRKQGSPTVVEADAVKSFDQPRSSWMLREQRSIFFPIAILNACRRSRSRCTRTSLAPRRSANCAPISASAALKRKRDWEKAHYSGRPLRKAGNLVRKLLLTVAAEIALLSRNGLGRDKAAR